LAAPLLYDPSGGFDEAAVADAAGASGAQIAEAIGDYRRSYGRDPDRLAWAPGRINLIGEHIDYCGGTVLPFAIRAGTWVAAGDAPHGRLLGASGQYPEVAATDLASGAADAGWLRYPRGVWQELTEADVVAEEALRRGHALAVRGSLMTFGGLSSSASLCLAVALVLRPRLGLSGHHDPLVLARLCQRVEQRHLGVSCGIMDQAAIALARPGHAMALRCDTLEHEPVPLPLTGHAVLAVHSGVPRSLAHSPYNARQAQVRAAETVLRQRLGLANACSLPPERLAEVAGWFDDDVFRRLRHAVGEQARVRGAIEALRVNDLPRFGACMNGSHVSLRDNFEVSCPELDLIHDRALAAGALGARS
jgi:galactokinase